jgi:hypothetical protein
MGFAQKRAQDTASVAFLRQVAGAFVKALTDIPELEIAREEVEVRPSEEVCEELLLSVPFGIGTEYITADIDILVSIHHPRCPCCILRLIT